MTSLLPKRFNSMSDILNHHDVDPEVAPAPASTAPVVPEESQTFSVATRDPTGLPPSSRLPTPYEGGTKRMGDVKKKSARKELLGD